MFDTYLFLFVFGIIVALWVRKRQRLGTAITVYLVIVLALSIWWGSMQYQPSLPPNAFGDLFISWNMTIVWGIAFGLFVRVILWLFNKK